MLLRQCARIVYVLAVLAPYSKEALGDEVQDAAAAAAQAALAIAHEENDATSAQQTYDDDYNTFVTLYNSYIYWYEPTYGGNTDIENALDGAQAALATAHSCLNTWESDDSAANSNFELGNIRDNNMDYLGAELAYGDATHDANNAETDAQGALCACVSAESDLNTAANLLNNPPQ